MYGNIVLVVMLFLAIFSFLGVVREDAEEQ